MHELGRDEHGTWLGAPALTVVQRGDEPANEHPYGFVKLIPPQGWWTAIFNQGTDGRYEIYIDIGTPAEWHGGVVRMVDLDLDVVRYRTGEVTVLDEDEFEEHRRVLRYPERIIDSARTTAARLAGMLERHDEPFGLAAERWLAALGDLTPG